MVMDNYKNLDKLFTADLPLKLKGIYNCNEIEARFLNENLNKEVYIYDIEIKDSLYVENFERKSISLGTITSIQRNDQINGFTIVIRTNKDKVLVLANMK